MFLSSFSDDGIIHCNSRHKIHNIMRSSDYDFSVLLLFDKKQNRDVHILCIPKSIKLCLTNTNIPASNFSLPMITAP